MLRIIIVEDELHSRESLRNLVNDYCEDVEVVAVAESVEEGLEKIISHKPDLLFLDIEMQTGTGFDLLEQSKNFSFEVIFTTAFEHYALKAIKFSAIDYLLKPIDVEELQAAVVKVQKKKDTLTQNKKLINLLSNIQNTDSKQHKITLATSEGLEFINVTDIIFCEANGSYTNFHLKQEKNLIVSKHLKEYENLLNEYNFLRVHQSYLINLAEVEKFVKSNGGYIIMKGGEQVSISHKKKEEFVLKMSEGH
ncbi:LytTR family DNA-binding domain-containing protein [Fulvivirgaceae bacterium BMA12]|uniref:LytTR family DNA-binding domain-containing protein n=1 Tax=Agaribacillus aureus TaxID=3051825 RepID=A0ABT8L171_9BACT|nr:LytTR family DNA-binding domain-containing protein [Fulvivirgaceae bacterium BMA12]